MGGEYGPTSPDEASHDDWSVDWSQRPRGGWDDFVAARRRLRRTLASDAQTARLERPSELIGQVPGPTPQHRVAEEAEHRQEATEPLKGRPSDLAAVDRLTQGREHR